MLVALLIVLVMGVLVLLGSPAVHRYVLRLAEQKLSVALNTQVSVGDFSLHFSGISPAVDAYRVTISGAAPHSEVPLLQADHVALAVRIVSVWHRNWYLQEVFVQHPVLRVQMDEHGATNLPHPRSSNSRSQTGVFDLGVRHAMPPEGEVYYNNRKTALDADLRDFEFTASFDSAKQRYDGILGYRGGRLKFGAYAPLSHQLQTSFAATPSALVLDRVDLTAGSSHLRLTATVRNYSKPVVEATYEASVDTGDLRGKLNQPALPSGILRLTGNLLYRQQADRPLLETLAAEGSLASSDLFVQQPGVRAEILDLGAPRTLSPGATLICAISTPSFWVAGLPAT